MEQRLGLFWEHLPPLDPKAVANMMQENHNHIPGLRDPELYSWFVRELAHLPLLDPETIAKIMQEICNHIPRSGRDWEHLPPLDLEAVANMMQEIRNHIRGLEESGCICLLLTLRP